MSLKIKNSFQIHKPNMAFPALSSIYDSTDNLVYEYRMLDLDALWDKQTERVNYWLDETELYQSRVKSMARTSSRLIPEVCSPRSRRQKFTKPHLQDLSYAYSDSEDDYADLDIDKYSVGSFSQIGPRRVKFNPLCPLCGKGDHYDKTLKDQCRLMTAILGKGWGSEDRYDPAKASPTLQLDRKVSPETAEEEQWMADLNLLTRFNEDNTYHVKTIRPRLVKVITTKHVNRSIIHSIRPKTAKTTVTGGSAQY